MTFTVTYRDRSGKKVQETFEAESRSDLFAQLKERKINALKVDNGNTIARSSASKSLSPMAKKVIAALLVVAVCGVVILALLPTIKSGLTAEKHSKKVAVRETAKVKGSKTNSNVETSSESTVTDEVSTATTNIIADVEEKPKTPEEIEAEARKKDPLYDRHHIVAKMPLVKEPIEQLMLTVFTTELGDMPPSLPAIPAFDEERFEKLVNRKTKPEKGDSEEVLLSKEIVNAVKKELAEYLKEGGTTSGFLSYYVSELDSAFKEREMCKSLAMKAMKTEDPEVAREYFFRLNEELAKKGIKPLTLNRRQKAHLGIEE